MRALHFVPGFKFGGVESLLMSLYRNIEKSELQFDLIVDTQEELPEFEEIRASGGQVFQLGHYLESPWKYQRQVDKILSDNHYPVLHCHELVRALPVLWSAKKAGVRKRILHSHSVSHVGSRWAMVAPWVSALSLRLGTEYWASSQLAGEFSFGKRQFDLFKDAISCKHFTFDSLLRKQFRSDLGISTNTLLVGHTGRFTYQKNHAWLVRVFEKLCQKIPDSHLLLVGDGPLMNDIMEFTLTLGVRDRVSFVGKQMGVGAFLSAMDVFLLPSHSEGFCISLLEAQANGLPCLATSTLPAEVCLTPSLTFCELSQPLNIWTDRIIQSYRLGRTDSTTNADLINQAGYEIETLASNLKKIYAD
jgi:glycosyltransferase involved in cell wall biosynthesis